MLKAPKKRTSDNVCPECGGRATKIWHLSDSPPIECQECGHHYNFIQREANHVH